MWVATTPLNYSRIFIIKRCNHCSPFRAQCSDNPRGFGSQEDNNAKKLSTSKQQKGMLQQQSKSASTKSSSTPGQAPVMSSRPDKKYNQTYSDLQFEEKLQAVKRSAIEKKKAETKKEFGPIDYDEPTEPKQNTIGLGTKIGVGVAVVVFGLVFALGDFLPSGSINSSEDKGTVSKKLSKEETAVLQSRLQQYEATLSSSPKDPVALEGAVVTLAELGEYSRAANYLEDLAKEKPSDPDVFRLLGEVKYELKDYEGSAAAYKSSAKMTKAVDFEVLRGLTNALLAAKKPDEAVQVLLESRERLNNEKLSDSTSKTESSTEGIDAQDVDPIQVELLLGKAYSDWGHISDAVSVYDQLISSHPNDFRGYLAKGIILKENGNVGDAERMFIQARFFAPEKAKAFVERYSRF
ncbi:protein SLOW GREEN 1 chloroplastic [Bienertia sinuspersici]